MKWLSIISILALAFVFNACEMHPVSDAPAEDATEFGKYEKHGEGKEKEKEKTEAKPEAESTPAAKPEAAATPEAKKGEAPKYFPESAK